MTYIPPDDVLPCGCIIRADIVNDVKTLTVIPCRLSCPNYRNLIGLADEHAIPVEYKRAP